MMIFMYPFLAHLSHAQNLLYIFDHFCPLSVRPFTLSNDNSSKAIEVICALLDRNVAWV